ncbi:serine/threonine kinase PKN13 [Corallococcus macrosporus]|uniref:Serine/threonine kinase PKN13 n=2 Tax=Myxococcaceae TaxID=31 RepID=F8CFM6_MYXFH|nr:serine/threonine kinase PKN13 [Corallococcus macrosporus]
MGDGAFASIRLTVYIRRHSMSGNRLPLAQEARTLGKYEVLCRLSTGGMAEIFLASQRGLAGFHKLVVLKQILPDIRGEEEFVRMFLDEAKVTAAFNHPHIAQVYDLDIADGELFLSMEFVPGATLVEVARACRQANTPIPMGYSLMAVRDTAVALHYAHTFTDPLGRPSPVIHRDVAEKNIMVTYEGVTKLLDFGIAKSLARASRTAVGMVKGTSGYMSPEQIMGEPLDARSDLFSLGVVLHECLTGMRLFYAKQADAMMNAVLRCEVTPPSRTNKQVPPELDAIVLRALSRRREDRYASTLEFARAIERAVGPLIWHPEQSSELMLRLFSDRRDQTRQLLMSGQDETGDTTGVVNLARVMAMGVEPSELPTGGVTVQPPNRGPGAARSAAPAPTPRRATAASPDAGTVRKAVLQAPPGKRLASRASPADARPPPPPPETMAPPPPPPDSGVQHMRTQPGMPAHPPEHTVRTQLPGTGRDVGSPPPAPAEAHPRQSARAATAEAQAVAREQTQVRAPRPPEPPPAPEEPRADATRSRASRTPEASPSVDDAPRPRSARTPEASPAVEESPRAEARSRASRTQDGLRAVPPSELPAPRAAAEDAPRARAPRTQDGLRAAPTPPPVERDLQTAMIRMPVPPPDAGEDTTLPVSAAPRRSVPVRRRSMSAEHTTLPVRVRDLHDEEDEESTVMGRGDGARATRSTHLRPPPRRGKAWVALTAVVGMLALGAAAVVLKLDGGVVSSRLEPLLGQGAPPDPQAGSGTRTPPAPGNADDNKRATGTDTPAPGNADGKQVATDTDTPAPGNAGDNKRATGTDTPAPGNAGDTVAAGADTPVDAPVKDGTAPPASGGIASLEAAGEVDPAPLTDRAPVLDEAPPKEPRTFKRVRNSTQRSRMVTSSPRKAPSSSEDVPAGEPGFLTLVTEPRAQVFLGGQDLGKTPLFKVKLPAGQHTLKLVDATSKAHQVPVDIKPGETTSVRGPLSLLSDP